MRTTRLTALAGLLAVVGLALLVVEAVRVLGGSALGSLATILLWVGLGLLVVGAVLLLVAVATAASDEDLAGEEPRQTPVAADAGFGSDGG